MKKRILRAVLDTCYLIGWLENTSEYRHHADAVEQIFGGMRRGEVIVILSAAAIVEISPKKHEDKERYDEILRLLRDEPNLVMQDMDEAVSKVVAHLRDEMNFRDAHMDAIHLGTAIYTRANVLYTTDKEFIRRNESLRKLKKNKPVEGFENLHFF